MKIINYLVIYLWWKENFGLATTTVPIQQSSLGFTFMCYPHFPWRIIELSNKLHDINLYKQDNDKEKD